MLNWIECKLWRKRSHIICTTQANHTHLVVQRKSVWQHKTIWRHDNAIRWQCKMQLVCAYCVDISRVRTFISTENENRVTDASGWPMMPMLFFIYSRCERTRNEWDGNLERCECGESGSTTFFIGPTDIKWLYCFQRTAALTRTHSALGVLFNFFSSCRLHFFTTKFRSHLFLLHLLRVFHSRTPSYENQIKHANKQTQLCD